MNKKSVIFISAALLLCLVFCGGASAATGSISGADMTVRPGDSFDYAVSVENNPGIAGFLVYVYCDTDVFSVEYDKDSQSYKAEQGSFTEEGAILANVKGGAGWQVLWYNATNATSDGTLFTLRMTAKTDAPAGIYPVTIECSRENMVNEEGGLITFSYVAGSIAVERSSGGDDPEDGEKKDDGNVSPRTSAELLKTSVIWLLALSAVAAAVSGAVIHQKRKKNATTKREA